MRVAPPLVVTDAERAELTGLVRSRRTSVRLALRARIVLLAAAGRQNKEIAAELGIGRVQVARWRGRYAQERLAGMTTMKAPGEGEELESLSVIENDSSQASQIRSISSDTLAGAAAHLLDEGHYKRPLNPPELPGATRCRTFHAKLNDGAVAYMNNQINEWADENPEVSIKYAASTIGVWEGKKADPHLILSVFY